MSQGTHRGQCDIDVFCPDKHAQGAEGTTAAASTVRKAILKKEPEDSLASTPSGCLFGKHVSFTGTHMPCSEGNAEAEDDDWTSFWNEVRLMCPSPVDVAAAAERQM